MVGYKILFGLAVLLMTFQAAAQTNPETVPLIKAEFEDENMEEIMSTITIDMLEKLRSENFNFNMKDFSGNTPLYYLLTRNPDLNVAKKAIEFGADVNMSVSNGMIPLNITTSKANELQLQVMMMKTLGLDVSSPEAQESLKEKLFREMNRMIEMAQMLIDNGADVNKKSSLGTPLMNAVTNAWNQEIVELFIKAGADLNAQDDKGRTALFYAAAGGNDDLVTYLLKAGADPDIKDASGKVYLDVERTKIDRVL